MELSQEKRPRDLIDAVISGDIEKVKFYLDNGYDVNYGAGEKRTSLHYGAGNGHLDICKLLLKAGAQVNAADEDNRTSLHYAADSGHFDICKLLLEAGAKIDAVGEFLIAAGSGNIEKVKSCLENGYGVNDTNESWENKTSLHYAAKNQHLDIFKLLLDAGAERDNEDLIVAAADGDIEKVKFYLENGYDVNYGAGYKRTSLHYAADNGHFDICKLLLEAGAKIDAVGEFLIAAGSGNIEKVKSCLENGYGVNDTNESWAYKTSLHYAAKNQHLDIFKLLLDAGAERDNTDLIDAVKSGDIEKVKFYLGNGYDVNYAETYGDEWTSLHWGAIKGHLDICKLLLEAGAQVNAVERKMRRPFS
ncbi:putative palmitoyltransferase ZDHHC13 [Glandiceps talaboti]